MTRREAILLAALCLLAPAILTPATAGANPAPQWAPPHVASGSPVAGRMSPASKLPDAAPDAELWVVPEVPVPVLLPTLPPPAVSEARAWALAELGPREYACLDAAIERESRWDPLAVNPRSGAAGLLQALPPEKQARFGADWRTNPLVQVRWAAWYVAQRYGSACAARRFQVREGWL